MGKLKIKYTDLALIIYSIRDSGDFDGIDDLDNFMGRLDELGDEELEVNEVYGITVYKIHTDNKEIKL